MANQEEVNDFFIQQANQDMDDVEDRRLNIVRPFDQIVVVPDRQKPRVGAGKLLAQPWVVFAKMRNSVQVFTGIEVCARHNASISRENRDDP